MVFMKRCCMVSGTAALVSPNFLSMVHTLSPFGTSLFFVVSLLCLLKLWLPPPSGVMVPLPLVSIRSNPCAMASAETMVATSKNTVLFI